MSSESNGSCSTGTPSMDESRYRARSPVSASRARCSTCALSWLINSRRRGDSREFLFKCRNYGMMRAISSLMVLSCLSFALLLLPAAVTTTTTFSASFGYKCNKESGMPHGIGSTPSKSLCRIYNANSCTRAFISYSVSFIVAALPTGSVCFSAARLLRS